MTTQQQPVYEVVWPLGKSHGDKRELNPGLGDLKVVLPRAWGDLFARR